jgi:hypothetical protein
MDTETFNRHLNNFKNHFFSLNGYFDAAVRLLGVYVLWILAHYFSSHLYVRWCVPASFIGLLISPFLVPAPHCQGLRWVVFNGAANINAMWLFLSTWFVSKLIPFRNLLNNEKEKEQ